MPSTKTVSFKTHDFQQVAHHFAAMFRTEHVILRDRRPCEPLPKHVYDFDRVKARAALTELARAEGLSESALGMALNWIEFITGVEHCPIDFGKMYQEGI